MAMIAKIEARRKFIEKLRMKKTVEGQGDRDK